MRKLSILVVSLFIANVAAAQSDDILLYPDTTNDSFACISTDDGFEAVIIDEPFADFFTDAIRISKVSDRLQGVKRRTRRVNQKLQTETQRKHRIKLENRKGKLNSKRSLFRSLKASCNLKALSSFNPCDSSLLLAQGAFGLSYEMCTQSDLTPLFSRVLSSDAITKQEGVEGVMLLDASKLPRKIVKTLISELETVLNEATNQALKEAAEIALSHLESFYTF